MGSQIIATCKCGLNKPISIGGGRFNYKEINYFPGLCQHCDDVVQVNIKNKTLRCPECNTKNPIPYNDPKVIGVEGQNIVVRSTMDILTDGTYHCPKCEDFNLKFQTGTQFWD